MQMGLPWADVWLILPFIILFFASLIPLAVKVLYGNREPALGASLFQGLLGVIFALSGGFYSVGQLGRLCLQPGTGFGWGFELGFAAHSSDHRLVFDFNA